VLSLSVWVDVNGAVFGDYPLFDLCTSNNYALGDYCNYLPKYSVLWYPLWVTQPLNWMAIGYMVYCVAVFVYLAAPLARSILSTTLTMARQVIRLEYVQSWRL